MEPPITLARPLFRNRAAKGARDNKQSRGKKWISRNEILSLAAIVATWVMSKEWLESAKKREFFNWERSFFGD